MKKKFAFFSLITVLLAAVFSVASGAITPDLQTHAVNFVSDHGTTLSVIGGVATIDTTRGRAAYDKAKQISQLIKIFVPGKPVLITNQDFFRSEVLISNTSSNYSFQTWQKQMDGTRATFPLQQGVADKDLYIGNSAGLYLDNRASAGTDIALQSYPNPFHFTTTNTGTPNSLWSFYNGILSLTVDRTVYIPRISTTEFLTVPQTQQSTTGTSAASTNSEFSFKKNLRLFDPYFLLSGNNTNYLTLTITPSGTFTPAGLSSTQNIVTFYSEGVTVQGGADFIDAYAQGAEWFVRNNYATEVQIMNALAQG